MHLNIMKSKLLLHFNGLFFLEYTLINKFFLFASICINNDSGYWISQTGFILIKCHYLFIFEIYLIKLKILLNFP